MKPGGGRSRPIANGRFSRTGTRLRHSGGSISGISRDRGCGPLRRVYVSLGLEVGRRACRYLQADGTFSRRASCLRTRYLAAEGTTRWRLGIKTPLLVGRYKLWVRGVDRAMNVERKRQSRNFMRMRMR